LWYFRLFSLAWPTFTTDRKREGGQAQPRFSYKGRPSQKDVIVSEYQFGIQGGLMPLVTTIIARLLALQDWYLGQFVDVTLVTSASPNNCWSFDIVNASVNACGQEFIRNQVVEEWADLLQAMTILIPSPLAF